ncbi:hypothetical protein AKJ09_00508 [Labilithrix luteola]|uniref:Outer membrane lipoprotein BamD-like domain-containing protein n=1 Tax=Labilithrix luteola TaxID=1391654 RepID=A0A0K1PL48_9BACT|nr:hypothetical protein [Labilithrix luteola]AKU93844.1 hypothetical protein AKJ09_00508 [Labilithrix luteola]
MSTDPPRILDLEGEQPREVELMRALIHKQRDDLAPLSAMPKALQAARTGRRAGAIGSRSLWTTVSALSVVAIVTSTWLVSSNHVERHAASPVNVQATAAQQASPVVAPPVDSTAERTATQAPEPALAPVPVGSLPTASRERGPARPASSAAESCDDEVERVDEADGALRAGNAKGALKLIRDFAARCPAGTFVQERERIGIEALAKLGRLDEMRERARAFEARFPSSPHLRRVRNIVDQYRD